MELKTIRQISLDYGVSRRMLCYYEEIGLIKSRCTFETRIIKRQNHACHCQHSFIFQK